MGLYHSIQKGSEMLADYLSRNVVESIEISDEDLASLQDKKRYLLQINQRPAARQANRLRLQRMSSQNVRNCKNMLYRKQNPVETN